MEAEVTEFLANGSAYKQADCHCSVGVKVNWLNV
jgi:hypothetical protein